MVEPIAGRDNDAGGKIDGLMQPNAPAGYPNEINPVARQLRLN